MDGISKGKNLETKWQKIRDLKLRARVHNFIVSNGIFDMAALVEKVTQINEDFKAVSDEIKALDRQIETRQTHLAQSDIYKKNKPLYDKYKKLDPKQAEAFYDKHFEEIQDYEAARDYLKAVMGEHKTIPVKMWENEVKTFTTQRARSCARFYTLKDNLKDVEALIRGAENIIKEEARETPERERKKQMEI
jgi:hypothetical protein